MARYRPVYIEIWNDEDEFLKYSDKEKVLFMYLITNSLCTESGIYKISPSQICFMLKWKIDTFEKTIKKLYPNIFYLVEQKIVFVKNFYKYNGMRKGRPDLIIKSIQKDYQNFPCSLWAWFLKTYPKFGKSLPKVSYETEYETEYDFNYNLLKDIKDKTWRNDFEIYKKMVHSAYLEIINNPVEMEKQQKYHNKLDIKMSLEMGIDNFWGVETGWKHKKKSRGSEIDMRRTLINSIDRNRVWKTDTTSEWVPPEMRGK